MKCLDLELLWTTPTTKWGEGMCSIMLKWRLVVLSESYLSQEGGIQDGQPTSTWFVTLLLL